METMAGGGEGEGDAHQTFEEGNQTLEVNVKGGTAPEQLAQMPPPPKVAVCQHDAFAGRRYPRELMEVFSVKLPEFEKHNAREQMYGCILIASNLSYVVLDRMKRGTPLNISAEGFLRLRGPNRVIDASDFVSCIAYLFKYHEGTYQFKRHAGNYRFICNDEGEYCEDPLMWNGHTRMDYNTLLTESVYSHFGPIVLNYAVYDDSAEAWVDVRVVPCQASAPAPAVFGTVTAHNSRVGEEGKSVLFERNRDDVICLDVASDSDKYARLPLSRRKTVHPRDSKVTICLDIKQLGKTEAEDQSIVSANPCFRVHMSRLSRQQTSKNGVWLVQVVVTWNEKEEGLIWEGPPLV